MITSFRDDNRFLSNFWDSGTPIMLKPEDDEERFLPDYVTAPTTGHLYQAAKCMSRHDAEEILNADSPGTAKKMGRRVAARDDWDDVKLTVMEQCIRGKFDPTTQPDNVRRLLATDTEILVEGNTWGDVYWGVDAATMEGDNNLGKMLMEHRKLLREGSIVYRKEDEYIAYVKKLLGDLMFPVDLTTAFNDNDVVSDLAGCRDTGGPFTDAEWIAHDIPVEYARLFAQSMRLARLVIDQEEKIRELR